MSQYEHKSDVNLCVISHLDSTNNLTWRDQIYSVIIAYGLESEINYFVLPAPQFLTNITSLNPEYVRWSHLNNLVKSWLYWLISASMPLHLPWGESTTKYKPMEDSRENFLSIFSYHTNGSQTRITDDAQERSFYTLSQRDIWWFVSYWRRCLKKRFNLSLVIHVSITLFNTQSHKHKLKNTKSMITSLRLSYFKFIFNFDMNHTCVPIFVFVLY